MSFVDNHITVVNASIEVQKIMNLRNKILIQKQDNNWKKIK